MNKKQESSLNMYQTVHETLLRSADHYAGHPALITATQDLGFRLTEVRKEVERQLIGTLGHAQAKAAQADKVTDLAMVVSLAMLAYATDQDDLVLAGRITLTRTALSKRADSVFSRQCTVVLEQAEELGAVLIPYGIDAALLEQLRVAIRLHEELVNAPRHAIATRKSATAALALRMKETQQVVALRIDGLMERYRLIDPAFFRAYRNARIIVDRGVRSAPAPQAKAA
jgi:hypothetical protein